jgi:hypothetical protein
VYVITLAVLGLWRATQATADEQFILRNPQRQPDLNRSYEQPVLGPATFELPAAYRSSGVPEAGTFSTDTFRPRGPSLTDQKNQSAASEDAPMLRGTTVWQRLQNYRAHGRVQLLTLWETGASSVSLQAGRKGEPSLQWSSHGMNRGGGSRGVFDQMFSTSLARASNSVRSAAREKAAASASKSNGSGDSGPIK